MPNFAVHDGTTVINVVVADSAEVAESVTGLSAIETTGVPWTGWVLEGDQWLNPDEISDPATGEEI